LHVEEPYLDSCAGGLLHLVQFVFTRTRYPRARRLNLQQTGEVQAKVQRLKTGPIPLREHTATEKHAGLEASRWQPHH